MTTLMVVSISWISLEKRTVKWGRSFNYGILPISNLLKNFVSEPELYSPPDD